MKNKRFITAIALLIVSTVLLSTASFAWFSMNTSVGASGFKVEAYSDSLILEIAKEKDGEYKDEVDFKTDYETSLRLVTLKHIKDGAIKIEMEPVNSGQHYSSADSVMKNTVYYKKTTTDPDRNDTYEGDNYLCMNGLLSDASDVSDYYNFTKGEIVFNIITDRETKFDSGNTKKYYKRIGNDYILLVADNGDTKIEINEIKNGEALRGCYEITLGKKGGKGAVYDGTSLYYEVKANGDISPVGSLKLGTSLDGLYTLKSKDADDEKATGTDKYYIQNDRDDYICIGALAKDTDLKDYICWARTYSSSVEQSVTDKDKVLNVIKNDKLENYYLQNTVYLRMNEDAENGKNLRIGSIEIEGEDTLTNAIRVYVYTENSNGEVSRAIYDNSTGTVTYIDKPAQNVLFETLPGHGADILKAEIYIYYDGTDKSAKTKDAAFSGNTVSINFEIDKPDYAP